LVIEAVAAPFQFLAVLQAKKGKLISEFFFWREAGGCHFFFGEGSCEVLFFFGQARKVADMISQYHDFLAPKIVVLCEPESDVGNGFWFNGVTKTSHVTETFVETSCSNMTLSS